MTTPAVEFTRTSARHAVTPDGWTFVRLGGAEVGFISRLSDGTYSVEVRTSAGARRSATRRTMTAAKAFATAALTA